MDDFLSDERAGAAERLAAEMERRRADGEPLVVVVPGAKRDLCTTFWGQAWNRNLTAYATVEAALPAARTCLRKGRVMDLTVREGLVTALVCGQGRLEEVTVRIAPLEEGKWEELRADCTGQVATLMELLTGKLSDAVMARVTDAERGLFPEYGEIRCGCTCPDWSDLCVHAAAVLYGTGCLLDSQPDLLFLLRGVRAADLAGDSPAAVNALTDREGLVADGLDGDLSALFGIDLSGGDSPGRQS